MSTPPPRPPHPYKPQPHPPSLIIQHVEAGGPICIRPNTFLSLKIKWKKPVHSWRLSSLDPVVVVIMVTMMVVVVMEVVVEGGDFTQCKKTAQKCSLNSFKVTRGPRKKRRAGEGEGHSIAVQQLPLLATEKPRHHLCSPKIYPGQHLPPKSAPILPRLRLAVTQND